MSALARWFNSLDKQVSGYDRTETPLTQQLEEEGIRIHYEDNPMLIDKEILEEKGKSLIVFTPAIPSDHKEFNYLKKRGLTLYKRSEVLGMITSDYFTVAVAGTHGKTSTTSIIAHILNTSGHNCVAFVGGIMTNYGSNLILPTAKENIIVVVEADEFDRSFLRLNPNLAVITAADADHLDIYGDGDHLKDSFRDFIGKLSRDGKLFIKERVAFELDVDSIDGLNFKKYNIERAEVSCENLRVENEAFVFDYLGVDNIIIEDVVLHFPGRHNVENALAAISIALELGVETNAIKSAIESYRGVKRRFEYILKSPDLTYIDDYAHHPEEIRSFLSALKELYPTKKITAIFQPHLYTRTRDFADGFAESLQLADEVLVMPIYPARELPIEGVDSQMIIDRMNGKGSLKDRDEVIDYIKLNDSEVLATIGAGDIDRLVGPIKDLLKIKCDAVN